MKAYLVWILTLITIQEGRLIPIADNKPPLLILISFDGFRWVWIYLIFFHFVLYAFINDFFLMLDLSGVGATDPNKLYLLVLVH
jgi:hypothetical protein